MVKLRGTIAKKILRQPKYCVRIPPTDGPATRPMYTAVIFIPKTAPLFSGGNVEARMAVLVPNIMAPPIPEKNRRG